MFKLEIKKIAVKSLIVSGYPFVVFVFSLLTTLMRLGEVVSPGSGFLGYITSILLDSIFTTGAIILYSVLAVVIYNTLINFGLKGVRFYLSEVEEDQQFQKPAITEEPSVKEEIAPVQQTEENK